MHVLINEKRAEFLDAYMQDGTIYYRFHFEDNPTRIVCLRSSHPDIVVGPDELIPNPYKTKLPTRNGRRFEALTTSQAVRLAYNCLDDEGRERLKMLFLGKLKE